MGDLSAETVWENGHMMIERVETLGNWSCDDRARRNSMVKGRWESNQAQFIDTKTEFQRQMAYQAGH